MGGSMRRARIAYTGIALCTIALGLAVYGDRRLFTPAWRDVLGDAIWACMMTWWIGAALPRARLLRRGLMALAVCWLVEFGQLVRAPVLDALRATVPGRLVLGTGFDPRDLLAYATGVVAAMALERALHWALHWALHRRREPH